MVASPPPSDKGPPPPPAPALSSRTHHHMVTLLQDGARRPRVPTDDVVRYSLPQALIVYLPSSTQEPTCYTQISRIPK